MNIFSTANELTRAVRDWRTAGKRIALVPTMGNLHAGHLALVKAATDDCDIVVTSIFVNPLQFGPNEDLDAYPRTLEQDQRLLEQQGCHGLFAPDVSTMYGEDISRQTLVHVPGLGDNYCGSSRPGHFDGVATVVCKLLNLCAPDVAFFGLKDYQQFLVIQKMVQDLQLAVRIEGVEIVRNEAGLALSSRNNYLSAEQQRQAVAIHEALKETRRAILDGDRDYRALEASAAAGIAAAGLRVDYFAVCKADNLQRAEAGADAPDDREDQQLAILAAAYVGPTRLIDNLRFRIVGS